MILDFTKVELIPGNNGKDCKGNGTKTNDFGQLIECCCEECDYYLCCYENISEEACEHCNDIKCPRANKTETLFDKASPKA